MRASWLVVLVACGGGTDPPAAPVISSTPAAAPPIESPLGPSTGMHGASIELVAVTDSGDAAVTADTEGALRLWPALDGTREPVVVTGPPPHALDIARDSDGYVIANHDSARGLELLRLDARGVVRTRAKISSEPAVDWTGGGELIARFPAGLAKLDRSTGALRERQCGWSFAISDQPFEHGADQQMVCDVSP